MLRICLLFVLALASPAPADAPLDIRGPAQIIDGDTLDVAGTRVRLFGIDPPELDQPCGGWACGRWARDELARLIGDRPVHCAGIERDRYNRLVARCSAGQGDLGRAMVQGGAALAYRRYSSDYIRPERVARAAGRGLWRDGGDGLTRPQDYRAARRTAPHDPAPPQPACAIKGNISSSGRVYHLPGQRDYDRTRIEPGRGERWFCSETEALAAGWRRAQR